MAGYALTNSKLRIVSQLHGVTKMNCEEWILSQAAGNTPREAV